MKNLGEFYEFLKKTKIRELSFALDWWKSQVPSEEWAECESLPITMETLVGTRDQISEIFAFELQGVSTDSRYNSLVRSHCAFITEYHNKARKAGFIITAKPCPISYTEMARDAGIVQVTSKGVSLTRKGEELADEVRREIEGDEED